MHLLVVGHDKHAAATRRKRALGVAEWGDLYRRAKDVKSFYAAADALILPTLYDPFPNVRRSAGLRPAAVHQHRLRRG